MKKRPDERRSSPVVPVVIEPHHCTPAEQLRILGATPFFRTVPAAKMPALAASFHQADYAAGTPIQRSGESATRLSIIAAGMVKLIRPTASGQDVLLDIIGPGEYFGSLADLGDATYQEDATAHTDCCILFTTAEEFRRLLLAYPNATLATLELVAARLRLAQESIEHISAHPVEQRVAATLLHFARRIGRQDGEVILIDMPLSRQDLADMTGATVETVSRIMSEFRRAGMIESGRRWTAIHDHEALANLAGHTPDRTRAVT
jgi:CRP-like cAMP-binding protein